MKTISKDVKLGGEVVETLAIELCENEDDLNSLGLEKVIDLVNRQKTTDECNACRSSKREKKPRATKKLSQILNILPMVSFEDGSTGWDKLNAISAIEGEDAKKEALDALLQTPEVIEAMKPPEAPAESTE